MKFVTLILLLLSPFAGAEIYPGQHEIQVKFGEHSFTDILIIEKSIYSKKSCEFSETSHKISGSFSSPGRFTVPLEESSCVGFMGQTFSAGLNFSILVDEGDGEKRYEFIGQTNYRAWSSVSFMYGDVLLEGEKIGTFSGSY
jgi:hypothetical protein